MFRKNKKRIELFLVYSFFIFFSFLFFFTFFDFLGKPPKDFPKGKIFVIHKGDGLNKIATNLEKEHFIKTKYLFLILAQKYKNKKILAGKYFFNQPEAEAILDKIISQKYLKEYQKFTIFEGEPNYLIAKKLAEKMKNIDENKFLEIAKKYEGKLFPDTYNLDLDFNEKEALNFFLKNFQKKIQGLKIPKNDLDKILKIASLIEVEAGSANFETKRKVASVIYNRLEKEMPLKLDYVFFYIQNLNRQKLSDKAIQRVILKGKKIDSPYNNYKYVGLPPTPISNPSLDSIKAAMDPASTDYLYYITGKDGEFYFAKTGKGHFKNIKLHLR